MTTPQRSAAPAVASQAANYATPDELDNEVRRWLQGYDREQWEPALVEILELVENSITFDDLREWIEVTPRRNADLLQAVGRVLIEVRRDLAAGPNPPSYMVQRPEAQPAAKQVEVEPPARPSTNGRESFASEQVKVIDWRRTRGTITEDGRILVQMSDGTKNPPWLELDDAGQHWMLDMIHRAQEVRA